jgi:hypothetical protein
MRLSNCHEARGIEPDASGRNEESCYKRPTFESRGALRMAPMMNSSNMRLVLVTALAGLCSACSSLGSLDPGNVFSFGATPDAKVVSASGEIKEINCPMIEVQDGTSAVRVGGQTNDSVRYQFDITNTARECHIQGDQFTVKVGVAGHLLIGPAGAPGAYSAQLRIVFRRESDQKPELSKIFKIDANTAGGSQGSFQFVSEPFPFPYAHREMDQDYTILVGFDTGHSGEAPKSHARKHHN